MTLRHANLLELLDPEAIREVVGETMRGDAHAQYDADTVRAVAKRMKLMELSPPKAVLDAVFEAERIAMAAETPVREVG